ncbi:MAG: HRDC domain-containing protein [Acinetobacter sp.]|nr:HRDC domain-containing protein [Acinetobacter sp.]
MTFQLIESSQDLVPLIQKMAQHRFYCLDTEFIRVKTRYPCLGLLQLNLQDTVYLIDPLKVKLDDFWQHIFQAEQLVLHSCSEDVILMFNEAQRKDLKHIFDTQVGLSFLGYGSHMGYQAALEERLNTTIYKYESRSNWLARPLTQEQLDYAANDVIYLPELAKDVRHALEQKGLFAVVLEDCQHMVNDLAKEPPLELLYLDHARHTHSPRQLAQLKQLTIWREELSIKNNLPLPFILKNKEMLDLVAEQPKNLQTLSYVLDKGSRALKYSHTLLKLLHNLPDKQYYPPRLHAPAKIECSTLQQQVQQYIERTAAQLDISQDILMRKKWLTAIIQCVQQSGDEQDLPDFLLGWRYDIITQPLLKLMYNSKSC